MTSNTQVARPEGAGRATCFHPRDRETGLIRGEDISTGTVLNVAGEAVTVIGVAAGEAVEIWLHGTHPFEAPTLTVRLDEHLAVYLPPEATR